MTHSPDLVAATFREEWGRLVAGLISWCGDFDLAEEGAAEAFEVAVVAWRRNGMPERPVAWLTTVARNRIRDRLRRRTTEAAKLKILGATTPEGGPGTDGFPDHRLRLIFTCCHPALPMPARVALTLRTLCGLTSAEIGRAFLVTEPTMAKRLVRARAKIRDAQIPYRVPPPELLPERLSGVLAVLYLMFNEGYSSSSGDSPVRVDLTAEAIRLTRLVHRLLPGDEVTGLLALMLLTDARRAARMRAGHVVTLAEQDRAQWDREQITEGGSLLAELDERPVGGYQVQARIAFEHDRADTAETTDWAAIADLYAMLPATPVTELNRAVAVSMLDGPAAALELIEPLADDLTGYHLYAATRADFLAGLGRVEEALIALDQAIELAPTGAERRLLADRHAELRTTRQERDCGRNA